MPSPPAKRICTELKSVANTVEPDTNNDPTKDTIAQADDASKEPDTDKGGTQITSQGKPALDPSEAKIPPGEAQVKVKESEKKTPIEKKTCQPLPGNKLNGYEANDRAFAASIDHVDLSRVIEGIQECDFEIEEMTISANQKVMEIEKSLRESKKPVYYKRSELIQHIPEFWLTTLINHHHISHFINEADEDCLQYLKKLHVEEFDDSVSGFKISFLFEANPYFENEVICKEISFGPSGVLRSKATPIRWRPGHDLTRVTEASASSSKSQPQSFFHWFLQNANPVQDKIAVFIRDDIWPNPLKYFQVHTEDSTIDISSDGIMVDSSGEEDEDESVLVLEEEKDEFDLDEDLELLDNDGEELIDEDFEDESEDDLLLDEDDEFDEEEDEDGIELIEAKGIPKQRTLTKKAAAPTGRVPAETTTVAVQGSKSEGTVSAIPNDQTSGQAVATNNTETESQLESSGVKAVTSSSANSRTEEPATSSLTSSSKAESGKDQPADSSENSDAMSKAAEENDTTEKTQETEPDQNENPSTNSEGGAS